MMMQLLTMLTWTDGSLALILGLLLLVWPTRYGHLVPMSIYRWGSGVGVILCVAWLVVFFYLFQSLRGGEGAVAIEASMLLAPSLLGAEAGMAGFLGFSKPWSVFSLVLAALSSLVALRIFALFVGLRLR